ncbi:MAG: hypothetical protein NUW06_06535 [Candidatus Acetothermia bacterium]|nr:hypothetical protein [Candidatus Acetothermia bacterium]MDH7505708.1 hypothetical protein [Candidatus Acetothermia bacterium]
MNRLFLSVGAIAVLLLLAFLGGMKFGRSQSYDQLGFGMDGEILVKVPYEGTDVLVKRYKNDDVIGILNAGLNFDESFRAQIEARLRRVEGLEQYRWESNELTLIKIDTARWEKIIQQIFATLFSQAPR